MKLLCHIAFFHYDTSSNKIHCTSNIKKGSNTWNNIMWNSLLQNIKNFNKYIIFDTIDVVVDTNSYYIQEKLKIQVKKTNFTIVQPRAVVHKKLSHPFHITSRHRINMEQKLMYYDWFLYTEVDTIIPYNTFLTQFNEAFKLWELGAVRTYGRTCTTYTSKSYGLFDILKKNYKKKIYTIDGKRYAEPSSSYSACWMYPQKILKSFINTSVWKTTDLIYTTETGLSAIREMQSKPLGSFSLVPVNNNNEITNDSFVYHTGGSYKLYCRKFCNYNLKII